MVRGGTPFPGRPRPSACGIGRETPFKFRARDRPATFRAVPDRTDLPATLP